VLTLLMCPGGLSSITVTSVKQEFMRYLEFGWTFMKFWKGFLLLTGNSTLDVEGSLQNCRCCAAFEVFSRVQNDVQAILAPFCRARLA